MPRERSPVWKRTPRVYQRCHECKEKYREEWMLWDGDFVCYPSCNESARKKRLLDSDPPSLKSKLLAPGSRTVDREDFSG